MLTSIQVDPAPRSGRAGTCRSHCEAAIGFTARFSSVVVGVHIGVDKDGALTASRLATFPTSAPHTGNRGVQLHCSSNGHGAGRFIGSRIVEQQGFRRLRDNMHRLSRRDRAL